MVETNNHIEMRRSLIWADLSSAITLNKWWPRNQTKRVKTNQKQAKTISHTITITQSHKHTHTHADIYLYLPIIPQFPSSISLNKINSLNLMSSEWMNDWMKCNDNNVNDLVFQIWFWLSLNENKHQCIYIISRL